MLRSARHIGRLVAILRTLARHDALFVLDRAAPGWSSVLRALPGLRPRPEMTALSHGKRLAKAFESLGPGFIKFGQGLSTRSDILGPEMAADLAELQDRLPPFSGLEARAAIEAELGRPVDELFAAFEDEAIAAASIAQVHFAVLHDNDFGENDVGENDIAEFGSREVAVKVLRPDIEAAFARDLDLFAWLAQMAERLVPKLRRLKPVASVEIIAATVAMELDLRLEAAAATELADMFEGSPIYRVPAIHWPLTGRRVMTAERIEGIAIHDVDALIEAGFDLQELVGHAAHVFFQQVFVEGFFHADMHPGNLFVAPDGALVAVDFGIMGRIDKRTRNFLADILVGFLGRDYDTVARVHMRAGFVPADADHGAFEQALRAIGDPILEQPTHEISIARLLAQLFHVTERFNMETQPQLLLLQKTMLLAEGMGRKLAPEVNMWFLARPLIEDWTRTHRGVEARVRDAVEDGLEVIALLPTVIRRLAADPPPPNRRATWPFWLAIAVLAVLVLAA